jgi:transcriptional regulator of acetoin/glycerol metabolism
LQTLLRSRKKGIEAAVDKRVGNITIFANKLGSTRTTFNKKNELFALNCLGVNV